MLLKVDELNSYYGTSRVLQGVSLTVDRDELVSIVGRNGMGKSTTLKSIMGLVPPRSGTVLFRGLDIAGREPHDIARMGIGYVPEERRIFPNLSVVDNLALGAKSSDGAESWNVERVFEYFPSLERRAKNLGAHLSGGEQQMLAIGRALMGNPELLLVDEPTEGLAPIIVAKVQEILKELNDNGMSVLLVEHNLEVALSGADRVYVMAKGYIGFSGTPEELRASPDILETFVEV